jgi:hypothetical protein
VFTARVFVAARSEAIAAADKVAHAPVHVVVPSAMAELLRRKSNSAGSGRAEPDTSRSSIGLG